MFTIYGGKDAFDQWDKGQRVTNPAMKAGDKVIFTNCTGETHPMKAYTHEGSVVCDVPNDLLMKASPILVDLCGSFEFRTRLLVMPRMKPEGYEYVDNTAYPQESTGSSGSGGLPSGGAPHQMLVTDADGKTVWEDRTHYTEKQQVTLLEDGGFGMQHEMEDGYWGSLTKNNPNRKLNEGEQCVVRVDGKTYNLTVKTYPELDAEMGNQTGFYLGNVKLLMVTGAPVDDLPDTGEPFVVGAMYDNDGPIGTSVVTVGKPETIGIDAMQEVKVPLDAGYIPGGGGAAEAVWFDLELDKSSGSVSVASCNYTYEQVLEMYRTKKVPVMVAYMRTETDTVFYCYQAMYHDVAMVLCFSGAGGTSLNVRWEPEDTFEVTVEVPA